MVYILLWYFPAYILFHWPSKEREKKINIKNIKRNFMYTETLLLSLWIETCFYIIIIIIFLLKYW